MATARTPLPSIRRQLPPHARRVVLLGLPVTLLGLAVLDSDWALADEAVPPFRVIVHPNNPARSATRAFLADAFLKKVTRWEGDEIIRPVDLHQDSDVRRHFTENVLKRSVAAVRSYWQQRIFSGRDVPPPEVDADEGVIAHVLRYPGAVGYIAGGTKLNGVRELALK
jgi:ABC-type phosphate transport system substrate-binding protein